MTEMTGTCIFTKKVNMLLSTDVLFCFSFLLCISFLQLCCRNKIATHPATFLMHDDNHRRGATSPNHRDYPDFRRQRTNRPIFDASFARVPLLVPLLVCLLLLLFVVE
jgi:hypothetical protein